MSSWSSIQREAPELAALALGYLDARVHKTLATLRSDGSPRISGTETLWAEGDLWIGSMWQALKALDLQRDPRFALHGGSIDPPDWTGDVKLAGHAEEISDAKRKKAIIKGKAPPGPNHLFRLDIMEVAVVRLGDPADHLVIDLWQEGKGLRSMQRR